MAIHSWGLLPLMLMGRSGAGRDRMLQELAPFLPPQAQGECLRTASVLRAAEQLRSAGTRQPSVHPRNSDPVALLSTLSHYVSAAPLQETAAQLQRISALRGMLQNFPQMMGMLNPAPPPPVPRAPEPIPEPPAPDFTRVADLQAALSRVDPATLARVQALAQSLTEK